MDTVLDYSWVTLICRELVTYSKRDAFDKEVVKMLILSWMPFEVRKTYKEMQEKMTFSYCAIGLYSL